MTKQFKFPSNFMTFICSTVLLLVPCVAFGQITNVTNDQSTPTPGVGHDYIKMLSETVTPANGQVSIRIQTPVRPGRRLTLPFAFAYDSNGVNHLVGSAPGFVSWTSNASYLSQGGWAYSIPLISQAFDSTSWFDGVQWQSCSYTTDYVFQDPSGGRHALGLAVVQNPSSTGCQGSPISPYSVLQAGDDFLNAAVSTNMAPVTVADADGTVYHFANPRAHSLSGTPVLSGLPDSIEDRNGNVISITDSGNGAFSASDTIGGSPPTSDSSSGFGSSGNTLTISGLGSYTVYWGTAYSSFGVGSTRAFDPNCPLVIPNEGGNQPVITAITLPNGQQYSFTYESTYGLLQQITYPTGGYVKYTWSVNPQSEFGAFTDSNGTPEACQYTYGVPAVSDRIVSFDGVNPALEQTFSYSTSGWNNGAWASKQTTVTTYDRLRGTNSTTVYNYSPVAIALPPNDYSYFAQQVPVEQSVVYNDVGRTVNKTWADQDEMQGQQVVDNGTVTSDQFFVFSAAGLVAGGQITDKYECGSGETCYNASQSSPPEAYARRTHTHYHAFAATPIYTAGPSIIDRPDSIVVYDTTGSRSAEADYSYDGGSLGQASGLPGHDDGNYSANYMNRGNATAKSEWLNTTGGSVTWSYVYDQTGQETSTTDANTNPTGYGYMCSGAYLSNITNALSQSEYFSWNCGSGLLLSSTDWNGHADTTSYSYQDSLNRLTQIAYPDGGRTTYGYANACGQPSSTSMLLTSSASYTETATMDGLCHVTQTAITSDVQPDYTDTAYDGSGRVWTVSNPYRSSSDPTYGLTTTTYDALGRTISVAYADGSATTTGYSGQCKTVTDPEGKPRTLCSDALGRLTSVNEAGIYNTSYTYNPLDNLLSVTQGSQLPGCTSQGSQVSRSFAYDSLGRLTSACNPESGTTSYSYDGNGNLVSKTAPAPNQTGSSTVTLTYAYDALNRKTYDYTNGVQSAYYYYDLNTLWGMTFLNPVGRLVAAGDNTYNATTTFSYDPMGRVAALWQCTPLNCGSYAWETDYSYNLAGDVTSWNHPARFTITQSINGARQISQVTSSLNDSTHPGTLATVTYTPFGSVSTLQNGCVGSGCTPVQETYFYNKRLQMAVAELGTSSNHAADSCRVYNYYVGFSNVTSCSESPSAWPQGTNDNGNVAGYFYNDNINTGLNHSAPYNYDAVNRLIGAAATGNSTYTQTFSYDAYGNLTCSPSGPGCVALTYNTATNQITTPGYGYDAAGNLTSDTSHRYQWDADQRLVSVDGVAGQTCQSTWTACHYYDASGQRVRDVTQTSTTDEAYGADGALLWRHTGNSSDPNQRAFVPFMGRILAEYYGGSPGGTIFDHPDEIGSISTSSDCTGNNFNEKLFYPFGESWTGAAIPYLGTHQTFAQLPDYDPETDQYNTANRHYSPMGRWMSPDPGGVKVVKLDDPQTWNMYAYVRNNPTTFTDPTGLYTVACSSDAKTCEKEQQNFENQRQKDLNSKDIGVQNAAKAWGNFGDTGVTVTFKSQTEVDADAGNSNPNVRVGAFVQPGIPSAGEPTPDRQAEFSTSLSGSDLRQAIAHEGSHVEDMNAFFNSYDVTTGRYNGALNPTHFSTEFQAYGVGSLVKKYSMFPRGPKGYQKLEDWIYKAYPNADDIVFPPSMYPQ